MPLLVPVERFGDGADVSFIDCVAALGGSGQAKTLKTKQSKQSDGLTQTGSEDQSTDPEVVAEPDPADAATE